MDDKVFIDTGAYYAAFFKRDQYREQALKVWQQLKQADVRTYTTNHIIDELATHLARTADYSFSAVKIEEIYDSEVMIYRPSREAEKEAVELFRKYADQKVSFTDCLSFVYMKRLSIRTAFTFDRHFADVVQFQVVPPIY